MTDQNRCYVPVELQTVVASILRAFPDDFVAHLEGTPPPTRMYRLPKITDMVDGTPTYDPRIALQAARLDLRLAAQAGRRAG